MSYEGQAHHPHVRGGPPNADRISLGEGHVPAGLQLVQAHWFVRHGERSPVRKRLSGFADIPYVFPLCAVGRNFQNAVLQFGDLPSSRDETVAGAPPLPRSFRGATDDGASFQSEATEDSRESGGWKGDGGRIVKKGLLKVRRLMEDQGEGNQAIRGGVADCYWGELTDLGRESTLSLGARLRSLYVDQLKFLPHNLADLPIEQSLVNFRSTGMPRTIESLHQVVEGLFPEATREGPVEYTVRNATDESLYPNSLCTRMRMLDQASAAAAAKRYNPTLEALDPLIQKYTGMQVGPLRIDSKPRANGILDTIYVSRAHGIRTPKEFEDPAVLKVLEQAVVHEWFDAYASTEFKKLAMGRLLGDLRASLERKVADPTERTEKMRLAVYACHDTSLGGILNSLDVFDGHWPPFTSHISVELFRAASTSSFFTSFLPSFFRPSSQHYVRVRYNSKPLLIPACQPDGAHLSGSRGEVCTMEAFSKAVEGVQLTAKEWEKGCAIVVGA